MRLLADRQDEPGFDRALVLNARRFVALARHAPARRMPRAAQSARPLSHPSAHVCPPIVLGTVVPGSTVSTTKYSGIGRYRHPTTTLAECWSLRVPVLGARIWTCRPRGGLVLASSPCAGASCSTLGTTFTARPSPTSRRGWSFLDNVDMASFDADPTLPVLGYELTWTKHQHRPVRSGLDEGE